MKSSLTAFAMSTTTGYNKLKKKKNNESIAELACLASQISCEASVIMYEVVTMLVL